MIQHGNLVLMALVYKNLIYFKLLIETVQTYAIDLLAFLYKQKNGDTSLLQLNTNSYFTGYIIQM
jgi:hypothetical protein